MEVSDFTHNIDGDDDDDDGDDDDKTYEWESSGHQLRMEIATACLLASLQNSHVACFNPSHAPLEHHHHHQRSPNKSRNRRTNFLATLVALHFNPVSESVSR